MMLHRVWLLTVAAVCLLFLGGCSIPSTPATSSAADIGSVKLTVELPAIRGLGLHSPLAKIVATLKKGSDTRTVESSTTQGRVVLDFPGLKAGYWDLVVDAVDTAGIKPYTGSATNIAVAIGTTTNTAVTLSPAPSFTSVVVDLNGLVAVGYSASTLQVSVSLSGPAGSVYSATSLTVSGTNASGTIAVSPGTYFALTEVKMGADLVWRNVYAIPVETYPGETTAVQISTPRALGQLSAAVTLQGNFLAPPSSFLAQYSETTKSVTLTWSKSIEDPANVTYYSVNLSSDGGKTWSWGYDYYGGYGVKLSAGTTAWTYPVAPGQAATELLATVCSYGSGAYSRPIYATVTIPKAE